MVLFYSVVDMMCGIVEIGVECLGGKGDGYGRCVGEIAGGGGETKKRWRRENGGYD